MLKRRKIKRKWINISVAILLVALILTGTGIVVNVTNFLSGQKLSGNNFGTRLVDPNTMDSYKDELLNDKNGSRYAGRIWSDKTTLLDKVDLDMETDGISKTINGNSEFIQVFSTLGSSEQKVDVIKNPLDLVIAIDLSSSMGRDSVDDGWTPEDQNIRLSHSRIYATVQAVNEAIDALMEKNPENRIAVIGYGANATVLLPLGQYKRNEKADYITIEGLRSVFGDNPTADGKFTYQADCFFELSIDALKKNGNTYDLIQKKITNHPDVVSGNGAQETIGFLTNMQGGIYLGLNELTSTEEATYTTEQNGKRITIARIPAIFIMTDGGSNFAFRKEGDNPKIPDNKGDEWYNVYIPEPSLADQYIYFGYPDANASGVLYSNDSSIDGAPGIILENLLTSSYMKLKVEKHYNLLQKEAGVDDTKTELNVQTIGVDLRDTPAWARSRLYVSLDPENYFKSDITTDYDKFLPETEIETVMKETLSSWNTLKQKQSTKAKIGFMQKPKDPDKYINIAPIPEEGIGSGEEKITMDEVIENINYADNFSDISSNGGQLEQLFLNVIQNLDGEASSPISGTNEAGVSDSLMYSDPMGKYMEIKRNGLTIDGEKYDMSLLLFGKLHNMRKVAVYDYTFNSTHRGPDHNSKDMSLGFTSGWYDKEGNYLEDDGSWDKGDTYYADVTQVQKYIPTLDESSNITPKQKKTIYTLYSFVDKEDEEQINPSYEDESVKYKVNDIRVWTEYTGNYVDEDPSANPNLGFDEALYVNIPTTALPLQMVKLYVESDGSISDYQTNLNNYIASTPLRLFYSVGVSSQVMTEDGLDLDLAKINQEYIQKNKVNDTIRFYANYYSNTKYDGYLTDTEVERTRGDASVSFSPSATNRYYTYQKPLPLYEMAISDIPDENGLYKSLELGTKEEYELFKSTHKTISNSSSFDDNKWYYIVVDYYMPGKSEAMHLAVPREGKEFGSGIGDGTIKKGEYLEWYSEKTDTSATFDASKEAPSDADDYVIATRPGGLRVGDLAQNLRGKTNNATQTAYNYYLPTISSSTSGFKTRDNNVIINIFLGNNGRLDVNDSLMMIAKEVKTDTFSEKTIDRSRDYQFEVKIDDHEGDYSAIKMYKNPYSNEWQLRLSTIDILTDNDGFLQDKDTKLYVYEDGDQQYYVYIGDNEIDGDTGGDDVFRVYSAPDNDNHIELTKSGMTTYVTDPNTIDGATKLNKYEKVDDNHTLGSIDFWIDKVYLIPTNIVDEKTWNHSLEDYKTLTEFVVAHLDSTKKGVDELTTSYKTETSYLTTTLKFGYTAQNKPETKPTSWTDDEWDSQKEHIAKLVLKDNEGIMLSGLKSGVNYETIEEITTKDNKEGYYFEEIKLGEEDTATITDKTVKGRVNANYIDEVEYINRYYAPTSLAIKKTVSGLLGEKEKDWTFDLTITLPPSAVILDSYDYHYDVIDGVTKRADGKITFESLTDNHYLAHLSIKHGETLVIEGLPEGTTYEVSENDANQNGYVTTSLNEVGTLRPTQTDVSFENSKIAKSDLTITKEVQGLLGDKEKEWEFEVTLKPSIEQDFPTNYVYTGTKNGTLELTPKEDAYVGKITLKHNDTITIKDIPENTTYEIKELDASKDGYISNAQNATGLIKGEGVYEARFTNIKYERHSLTISKEVTGSAGDKNKNWKFKIVFTPDTDVIFDKSYPYDGGTLELTEKDGKYTGEITLRHNESITIKNIPERTNYDIEEVEANANDYQTFITGNQSGIMNDDVTVKYTNRKLSKQDLTISKEVTGAWASKDKEWTFTVKLTPSKDVYLNGFYHYEGSKEGEMELTNNSGIYTGKITLKSGESITLKEIPEGTAYEVSEDDANTDGYTTRVTGDTKGVLAFNTPTPHIAFENIKLSKHSLTISKEVAGGASDPDKEWTFSLTLTSKDGVTLLDSYPILGGNTASEVSVIDEKRLTLEKESDTKAKATFKLKGGQSITINDLPEGTTYEVKELEANTEGYDTRITGDEKGVLENVDTKSVKYVNHKALKYDLSIGKVVKGGAGEKDASWAFNITLTPMDGEELLTTYLVEGIEPSLISLTRTEDGYKGSLSLKHGDTATIKGIPENTGFKIEEVEANKNEYITEVNNPNTGILDKQLDPIIFTNTKLAKYNLTIVKTVKGNLGDKDKEWTFKVLLTPPPIKDLDKEYAYTKENAHGTNLDGKMSLNKVSDHYEGEVSIKDQEKITIKDLPEGTTYQVVEQGAEADGYKVATDNDNGILNDHQMVKVTNTKVSYHDLQIESHLKGNNPDPEIEWDVEVTLTPSSDSGLEDSYVWVDDDGVSHLLPLTPNDDGTYTGHLSLKGNSHGTIKDLPYGTTYEVKVQNANQDGHKTTIDENSGVLSENMEVTFTNERNLKIPNTLDDIMKYIIIFVMALIISSCGLYLYLQKRGTNN